MGAPRSLNIAIFVNHPPTAHFWIEVQQAFSDSFKAIAPEANLTFFDPVDEQKYPDSSAYDLLILSGGKADASASDPWILKMLDFIRTVVREAPRTKILGICWGHQALIRALGGSVGPVPGGPVSGLTRIALTEEGKKFFPFAADKGSFLASQFHVREVKEAPESLIALAENNEAFISKSNMLLSFQAHPEIAGKFAVDIMHDGDTTYTVGKSEMEIQGIRATAGGDHDGLDLLRRVVEWVSEK